MAETPQRRLTRRPQASGRRAPVAADRATAGARLRYAFRRADENNAAGSPIGIVVAAAVVVYLVVGAHRPVTVGVAAVVGLLVGAVAWFLGYPLQAVHRRRPLPAYPLVAFLLASAVIYVGAIVTSRVTDDPRAGIAFLLAAVGGLLMAQVLEPLVPALFALRYPVDSVSADGRTAR